MGRLRLSEDPQGRISNPQKPYREGVSYSRSKLKKTAQIQKEKLMHPYFSTQVQPWQTFNPIDIGMYQRPSPWFDPSAYQAMFNPAPYRGAFPGFETNPYYANNPYYTGIVPRPGFPVPPLSISQEMAHGMPPV